MPSVSKAQQQMMGMALSYKRGETTDVSDEVKKLANSMSEKDLEDFAKTKHDNLPNKVKSESLGSFKDFIKESPDSIYSNSDALVFIIFKDLKQLINDFQKAIWSLRDDDKDTLFGTVMKQPEMAGIMMFSQT